MLLNVKKSTVIWSSNNLVVAPYRFTLPVLTSCGSFLLVTNTIILFLFLSRCLSVSTILSHQEAIIRRRRHSQFKVARMIGVAVLAFMVSWSPYCIVSIVAVFNKTFIVRNGEAEIPELMAKASVIYNPVVYALMNAGFRRTVKRLFRHRSCYSEREDSQATPEIVTVKFQVQRMGNTSSEYSPTFRTNEGSS